MLGSLWFNSFSSAAPASTDYELITTSTVSGSSVASLTFTKSAAWDTYKHLQIRFVARGTNASSQVVLGMRYNGDTGLNYSVHRLGANGSTVVSSGGNNDWAYLGIVSAASATSGSFGAGILEMLDWADTNKRKTTRSFTGTTAGPELNLYSSAWYSGSAITSIAITSFSGGNIDVGSRFSLYGLKG